MIGLSASTAARKNCFTAASLYFCCVNTATSTSAAWRIARARCQFTAASESTSGASSSSSRGGIVGPTRQNSRFSAESPSGSSADCQACRSNGSNSRANRAGSAKCGGTRHTGCFVPAASGLAALATSPASWLKIDRLADVRAADDRHDQQRRQIELGQQLVLQQIEPLLAGRRRHARRGRPRLQGPDRPIEPSHLGGEGLISRSSLRDNVSTRQHVTVINNRVPH